VWARVRSSQLAALTSCLCSPGSAAQSVVSWQRAAAVPFVGAPLGVAFFVGLANLALSLSGARSGATAKWKAQLGTALKAFSCCNDARMVRALPPRVRLCVPQCS